MRRRVSTERKVIVRKLGRLIEPIMGNTLAHPYKTQNLSVKCNITENIYRYHP